uniref:Uncharacterized protein n=1 Tax=Chromera velia CCMP2878 TaxID=1169474 RepID=A0A0G4HAF4_9ALVE|eukprot:Cvel_908.t1-p1 / transcript=Cvel_908.t1 / gene=Cvel_908 / organism=Chromera_velia_CCMP2878 / gene_product=hypothetical protein / transcript_product=hypothetical protein / location=Cvel_scaffold28:180616-181237(-) / protein_length=179 / sequence_SO=supercontig / SO=protein_coding / is_pseudo=false
MEERIFKSRLYANGSPHFDRCQDVPVSNTTAAQWALRLAFCITFASSDFDPLTGFIVGDIENAYLTASRPASKDDSPAYVRPPPDHPQFLTHLWCMSAKSHLRLERQWVHLRGASGPCLDGGRVDEKRGAGAVVEVDRKAWCCRLPTDRGPFTIKETYPTDEGKVRWAGVDFKLKKDEI